MTTTRIAVEDDGVCTQYTSDDEMNLAASDPSLRISVAQLALRGRDRESRLSYEVSRQLDPSFVPGNKHDSLIYFSLNNGPLLNGSITLKSNVGGIPS
jgi:hypothetical protein